MACSQNCRPCCGVADKDPEVSYKHMGFGFGVAGKEFTLSTSSLGGFGLL